MLCNITFTRKNSPEFPGNFPGKFLPGIFDISEIFPEIFPKFSWSSTTFLIIKIVIFALYHCICIKKYPELSGNFPENFREISGEIFREFSEFRKLPGNFPEIFIGTRYFYNSKKLNFWPVKLRFTLKNHSISREVSREVSTF